MTDPTILSLGVALGVGLLIGAERERRKGEGPSRSSAGVRTFAAASLSGAVACLVGGAPVVAMTVAAVGALAALSYWRNRDDDPGLTTEVALVQTVLLGALSVRHAPLAAGAGVAVAALLAARAPLHHFVRGVLTQAELNDGLILASATLVVLPLLPDRAFGPYGALNPHAIWLVAVLVLAISAAGHVAVRLLGVRFGLPIAGLASGFVSSIATIGAMGARVRTAPSGLAGAVAGAVLSTLATVVQMAAVIAATSLPVLRAMGPPLICAGIAAGAYGLVFSLVALRQKAVDQAEPGQAFSVTAALGFGATLAVVLVACGALRDGFGQAGAMAATAVAGLVDTHAAAISMASLAAAGKLSPSDAVMPILVGLSTNTISKMIFAATSGGRAFAARVIPGLVLVAAAAWGGWLAEAVVWPG
ncbi:MgtC/SapB family protein [Caulobacter sp. KR2-114]|uniref:MgtC/SapB family protein n=1 Tax=Caulobacter sp. KR2-114 TaxID=3400912 RepID=UPI003C0E8588